MDVKPPFKRYIFIERNSKRISDLEDLRRLFPDSADKVKIVNDDANVFLQSWCRTTDWRISRAVVFLDPYGMQVEWKSIEAIAGTKAIDLWILFPMMAVNRVATKNSPPPDDWAQSLTRIFGTTDWESTFYLKQNALTLFGDEEHETKQVDIQSIDAFFVKRLEETFPAVAKNSRLLCNSTNSPLFLLCFASANPSPSVKRAALNIAEHILKM